MSQRDTFFLLEIQIISWLLTKISKILVEVPSPTIARSCKPLWPGRTMCVAWFKAGQVFNKPHERKVLSMQQLPILLRHCADLSFSIGVFFKDKLHWHSGLSNRKGLLLLAARTKIPSCFLARIFTARWLFGCSCVHAHPQRAEGGGGFVCGPRNKLAW